jgi:hypothetical protein
VQLAILRATADVVIAIVAGDGPCSQ